MTSSLNTSDSGDTEKPQRKIGQFGYLKDTISNSLEESFVLIVNICSESQCSDSALNDKCEQKYEFMYYDITSSAPKRNKQGNGGRISAEEFVPITGTLNLSDLSGGSSGENSSSDNDISRMQLLELLNWKICREDYLLKKMYQLQVNIANESKTDLDSPDMALNILNKSENIRNRNAIIAIPDSTDDGNETSYMPESISDSTNKAQSTEYTSTDNDSHRMSNSQSQTDVYTNKSTSKSTSQYMTSIENMISGTGTSQPLVSTGSSSRNMSNSSGDNFSSNGSDCQELNVFLNKYGYKKTKNLWHTLKGELFVAESSENINGVSADMVCIKKMVFDKNYMAQMSNNYMSSNAYFDSAAIKEALLMRQLKIENKLIRNSIVKYVDFFQSERYCYPVIHLDFRMNLKHFVNKSHEFIGTNQLSSMEYRETIQYLLWRLSATIHWLHDEKGMNCCDLDICPENVLLTSSDFVKTQKSLKNSHSNSDSSSASEDNAYDETVNINLQIDMKLIDFNVRELLKSRSIPYDTANPKYVSQNEVYIPTKGNGHNEEMKHESMSNELETDLRANDMWAFGILMYFCFIGNYPYTIITKQNKLNAHNLNAYDGYWALYNGKLKAYLSLKNSLKLIDSKISSLLNGLLNIDQKKRLNSTNVLQHQFFNSFYKTYMAQFEE